MTFTVHRVKSQQRLQVVFFTITMLSEFSIMTFYFNPIYNVR